MSITQSTIFETKCNLLFFSYTPLLHWPEGVPYDAWYNFLKRLFWFRGKSFGSRLTRRKNRRISRRSHKLLKDRDQLKDRIAQKQTQAIINGLEASKLLCNDDVVPELVTMLKQFWDRRHIPQKIEETIPDRRNQDLITYSKQSIVMSGLAIFLFRMGSGNKFDQKSHDNDEKYSIANISAFISAPEGRVPVIKTIEKFLKNLEEGSINNLMIAFFKDLQKSKFFRHHPQLTPGHFLLAADCVHTHTYEHPHHTDMEGQNNCSCCLKRVYNKGTKNEKVKWIHSTLVFCFVFCGGLKLPIYRYPIHAKQVVDLDSVSDDRHKQECELVALKAALPIIREAFPRMKIVLLLDGLYANKPVIRLAEEQRCGYIIVRKEACLSLLAKECDEHANYPNHKKNCVKRCHRIDNKGWSIEERYAWFNNKYLGGDVTTNVLRFSEIRTKEGKETQFYKCEWLFSWKLSAQSCELAARQARSRWEVEDLFNTLKNRGFNLNHDYSRDPRSCFNWQGLSLFAFGIFELFRFSQTVKKRGNWNQNNLAEKLLGQLLHRPTGELFSEKCLSKRVQFRYHFVVERISSKEVREKSPVELLDTG